MGHDVGGGFHGDAHVGDSFDSHHGGGGHGDADHPDSTHLFAIVSFKTLVAAAAFFGITGLATSSAEFPATTTLVLSIAAGAVAMYGMYGLLRLIASLSSSGNERIDNAVGLAATVYVPIPATGKGAGKVQLSMQNRIVEYQAVTDDAQPLKTGEAVEVVGIRNSDTLEVRRVAKAAEREPAAY
jgi:membrane-bound ClpP family serine protease